MVVGETAIAPSVKVSGWTVSPTTPGEAVPVERKGETLSVYVDGDIIAYRCAAAANGTYYEVGKKEFKYHKMAMAHCTAHDIAIHNIVKEKRPEPWHHVTSNIDSMMSNMAMELEELHDRPVELVVFLTGNSNFRLEVNPDYKSSRKGSDRPHHLRASKEYLEGRYDATYHDGLEADDLMVIHATANRDSVIASIDKDLLQCPGNHYDFIKKEQTLISFTEGKHRFWSQVLTGDKTDDIIGLHGIGPVKAHKILKDCEGASDFQYYVTVLSTYLDKLPRHDDEDDEDFYTRTIKHVTSVARQINLLEEYGDTWEVPQNENLSVIQKVMSLETLNKDSIHDHLLVTIKEAPDVLKALGRLEGSEKIRLIDTILNRHKIINTIEDDPMLTTFDKTARLRAENFTEDDNDASLSELIIRRKDY